MPLPFRNANLSSQRCLCAAGSRSFNNGILPFRNARKSIFPTKVSYRANQAQSIFPTKVDYPSNPARSIFPTKVSEFPTGIKHGQSFQPKLMILSSQAQSICPTKVKHGQSFQPKSMYFRLESNTVNLSNQSRLFFPVNLSNQSRPFFPVNLSNQSQQISNLSQTRTIFPTKVCAAGPRARDRRRPQRAKLRRVSKIVAHSCPLAL